MAAGAVQQACAAARAAGCQPDVDYHGEHVVDWTAKLGDPDHPTPTIHAAFGYAAQLVVIDRETTKVDRVVAIHDVGRAVNPQLCTGQIEGSVHMGLGYALSEDFPTDPSPASRRSRRCASSTSCGRKTCQRSRSSSSRFPSPGRRSASRASARSASFRRRRQSPQPFTTSTGCGGRVCR